MKLEDFSSKGLKTFSSIIREYYLVVHSHPKVQNLINFKFLQIGLFLSNFFALNSLYNLPLARLLDCE